MARNEEAVGRSGWRGSREAWLDAAYRSLVESGVGSVKILPLAEGLGVARTSFYWFFRDRDDLLDALLDHWKERNSGALGRQAGAYAEDIVEAILNVFDCWLNPELFDSRFEFAVRSWAIQSPVIAGAVARADADRIVELREMFGRFGFDQSAADVRARCMYLTQIGYITMNTSETIELRMRRIPDYVEVFCGTKPSERHLARFRNRHGFAPGAGAG